MVKHSQRLTAFIPQTPGQVKSPVVALHSPSVSWFEVVSARSAVQA
jgi:hypothetical protein